MFSVITVAREYGSGGGAISRALAARLGWNLLDSAFVTEVARQARVDPALARAYDERVDSWLHRIGKGALWHGTIERVPAVDEHDFFDADTMADLSATLIRQAAALGHYVIVGRGGQCLLQRSPQVFHVFIYASLPEKIARVRRRLKEGEDAEAVIHAMEKARADYARLRFACARHNPHLYNLMASSSLGEERVVAAILAAAGLEGARHPPGALP